MVNNISSINSNQNTRQNTNQSNTRQNQSSTRQNTNQSNKKQNQNTRQNTRQNQNTKQSNSQDISNIDKINYTKSNLNLEQSSVTNNEVKLLREITDLKNQNKTLLEKLNRFVKQSEKFKELKKEVRELKKIEKERKMKDKLSLEQPKTRKIEPTESLSNNDEMFLKDFLSNSIVTLRPSLLNFNDRILVQNPFENMQKIVPQNIKSMDCKDDKCKNKYMFYTYKSSDNGDIKEGKEVQVIGDGKYATVTEKSLPSGKKRVFKIKPEELPKLLKM